MSYGKNRPVALITGASGGIGAELAREIAADGYNLVLVARNDGDLEKVADELDGQYGTESEIMALDLTLPSQVEKLFKSLEKAHIHPELIVNNAGYGLASPAADSDVVGQLGSINLNISVLTELILRFLPQLRAKGQGGIINVGSVAGFFPGPYFAVYYATKAYVQSFTHALAHELKDSNIKICVICPGSTATGFHKRAGLKRSGMSKASGAMQAKDVAKIGYSGYKRGRTVVVTGSLNRFFVMVSHFIPNKLLAYGVSRFNKPDKRRKIEIP